MQLIIAMRQNDLSNSWVLRSVLIFSKKFPFVRRWRFILGADAQE